METNVKINRGLKGVYFERSGISDIDGSKGELTYRGYQIDKLAKHSSFEEVCYLLIFGELPSKIKFDSFNEKLKNLPGKINNMLINGEVSLQLQRWRDLILLMKLLTAN